MATPKTAARKIPTAVTSPLIKRVMLELGGNSPFVVLDDADLDRAVPAGVFSRFLHQGQICMSSNRLIVDAKLYDQFVERFVAHVKKLKYGNPSDPDTVIGPVINRRQLERMMDIMNRGRAAGRASDPRRRPRRTVDAAARLRRPPTTCRLRRKKTFGPIAPIIKVNREDEALRVANDTEYGLSSAVFSRDEARGLRFALGIEAGMTHINDASVDDTPTGPFGGEKNSGIGRFGGEWVLEEFTTDHWVTAQHTPRAYPF